MIDGIHHVYVETHDWSKSAAFWQALGYSLAEQHGGSGILRPSRSGQPYIYLAEVPSDREPILQLCFNATAEFEPTHPAEAGGPWQDSHWDTRIRTVKDPDGREHMLQVD